MSMDEPGHKPEEMVAAAGPQEPAPVPAGTADSPFDPAPAEEPPAQAGAVTDAGSAPASEVAAAAEAEETPAEEPEEGSAGEPQPPRKRPPHVPEAFWDAERGELRTDALLAAFAELRERVERSLPLPRGPEDVEAMAALRRALGWPERPEDYEVEPPHPLIARDAELERRLHAAGFTNDQLRLVYELAAERLLPAVAEVVAESVAARERERLAEHFGGEERFEQVARELRAFGQRHLDPETYAALSSSYAGVLALYRMAAAEEPEILGEAGAGTLVASEEQLVEMMRDPRYWRDRDPEFVARVTEGFRRLYGD